MISMKDLHIGSRVHYQPEHYNTDEFENGIVKEIREEKIWVVYNCAGEWDRYTDYTGALTNLRDLKPGWWQGEMMVDRYRITDIHGTPVINDKWVKEENYDELDAECDDCKTKLDAAINQIALYMKSLDLIREVYNESKFKNVRLIEALKDIMNELGVPHSDRPQNIANAFVIAENAIEENG